MIGATHAAMVGAVSVVLAAGLTTAAPSVSSASTPGVMGQLTTLYVSSSETGSLTDVVAMADGTTYVADGADHTIRTVAADGTVSVVAGSTVGSSFTGEGGPATSAVLPEPTAIAVATDGTLYVGTRDGAVRAVDPSTHVITTVLGFGADAQQQLGPLPGPSFPLRIPHAISAAPDGSLLVLDSLSGDARYSRLVRLSGGTAVQLTSTGLPLGSGDVAGQSWGVISSLAAVAAAPDGRVWGIDSLNRLYSGTVTTIEAVRRAPSAWPLTEMGFVAPGDLVVGPLRLRADGSADDVLWGTGLWPAVTHVSITSGRAVLMTPTEVYERTLPDALARPQPPVGSVVSAGAYRAIAVAGLTGDQTVRATARPGAANPAGALDDGTLVLVGDSEGLVRMTSTDDAVGWGNTVTATVWAFDPSTGTYSSPTSWSLDNYRPITCSLTPTSRVVPYGEALTFRAKVLVAQSTDPRSMVVGSWLIAPGGATASSYAAAPTTADGTTTRSFTPRRTTRVTYSHALGVDGPCSASVVYTVVPKLTTSLSRTSAPRGASFTARAALTSPKAVSELVTVQRRSGTSWVTMTSGRTGSEGTRSFGLKAPTRAGTYYYRVVHPASAAYGVRYGPSLKLVVR